MKIQGDFYLFYTDTHTLSTTRTAPHRTTTTTSCPCRTWRVSPRRPPDPRHLRRKATGHRRARTLGLRSLRNREYRRPGFPQEEVLRSSLLGEAVRLLLSSYKDEKRSDRWRETVFGCKGIRLRSNKEPMWFSRDPVYHGRLQGWCLCFRKEINQPMKGEIWPIKERDLFLGPEVG